MQENNNDQGWFTTLPKLNFKTLIIVLVLAVGLYFLIPKLVGIQQVGNLILQMNKFYLLLALICEILSYVGAAWLLGIILHKIGYKIDFWSRFKLGSITAFAIHFIPVGSFGNAAIDYYFLKKREVSTGSVLIMLILRLIFTYAAFLLLFLIALILVPVSPYLPFSPKLISIILFLIILSGVLYLFYLYKNKIKFKKSWFKFVYFINRVVILFKKSPISDNKINQLFDDFYTGIALFTGKKRTSVWAIAAGLIYWLGDVMCLFFVFLSFGYLIHFGALLLGYSIGTLAGIISFIPGGLGVTEGTMALMFSGLGVPVALSFTAILVFRFFSFWIWIPIGLYSFFSLQKNNNENN